MALTKVPSNLDATISVTQSASDNSTNIATTAYVTTAIANLVDSSPSALNTLNELAAALGDDANFASTINTSLGTKLNLSGGTLTGGLGISYTNPILSLTTPWSTGNFGQIRLGYTAGTERSITGHYDDGLKFKVNTHDMIFNTSGNLGVGTTSPGAVRLYSTTSASGNLAGQFVNSHASGSYGVKIQAGSDSSNYGFVVTNKDNANPTQFYVRGDGNIGIGNNSPSAKLDVVANNTVWAGEFTQSNTSNGDGVIVTVGSTSTNDYALSIRSDAGNTSGLAVKANGHVGIGTFAPSNDYLLDVGHVGSGAIQARFKSSGDSGYTQGAIVLESSDNTSSPGSRGQGVYMFNHGTDKTWYAGTLYSGPANYGIGVVGGSTLQHSAADDGSSLAFVITGSRNVGIGTAGPNQKLNVVGTIGVGGDHASVGIGSTMADANIAELGPGYLNLARDDTADAKQISFSKNAVRVSDISTTDKGIKWEVLESSGNAAAFQFTNGVGVDTWSAMDAQGHKWQDNVYNVISAGAVSIGSDSSNTSHMWWNCYDRGTKHGVSSGYGMDEYVSNATGDYSIRMSDNSSFTGDGIVLTERYRFENGGALNIYATGSAQASNDGKLYITKNTSNDWSVKCMAGNDDYGMVTWGNGGYALGIYNQPSSAYRARMNYNGELYLNGGSSAVLNINSDARLKEDISDAPSQWELIKGLPLQRFKWIDRREGDKWSYGFIAQEVEKTNPEFVQLVPQDKEDFDNGIEDPEYKTVAEGQIHERALAALQEAMARIEALEAEVAALKG